MCHSCLVFLCLTLLESFVIQRQCFLFLKKRTYNCVSCVRMLFSLESIPDSFTVGINLFVLCCCVSISVRPYHSLRVFVSNSETNNVPLLSSIVFLQKWKKERNQRRKTFAEKVVVCMCVSSMLSLMLSLMLPHMHEKKDKFCQSQQQQKVCIDRNWITNRRASNKLSHTKVF